MLEYIIVADDYTGAAETAAKFMNGGYRPAITLDIGSLGAMSGYPAVALDTETFFSPPEVAARKLTGVGRSLLPWKNSATIFKRIEPGLRGNAGPEVCAMSRILGFDWVIVVPAFSRGRRSIEEGTLYLDAQDQENIPALIPTTTRSATLEAMVGALSREGMNPKAVTQEDIREGRVSEIVAKKGCFCFDAETDEDLKMIVKGVLKLTPARNVLWVGAMGLAEALATAPRPFVVVVGTAHPRSIRQARQLLEQAMVSPVQLTADVLSLDAETIAAARARATSEAEELLRCGQSVLLAATINERFVRGQYPNDDIDAFLGFLADTVREILGRVRIGGLCVTGGDCAVRIFQRARAESLIMLEEIQEGITLSEMKGGTFDGLRMITKSGQLGGERALVHCMEYFLQDMQEHQEHH